MLLQTEEEEKLFPIIQTVDQLSSIPEEVKEPVEFIGAYDINQNANLTYTHNFRQTPIARNVQDLTYHDIDGKATCWLLSPPCQPYTKGGLRKQSLDSRADGFHHLLGLLR